MIKKSVWWMFGLLLLGLFLSRLVQRLRQERSDRSAVLLAEWIDARDLAARLGLADKPVLSRLRASGVHAVVLGEATVNDYLSREMLFLNRSTAMEIQKQFQSRGVSSVRVEPLGGAFRLVRGYGSWTSLKEMTLGIDPELLQEARRVGLEVVLRLDHDPWLPSANLIRELAEPLSQRDARAVLINSDTLPGGPGSLSAWVALLREQGALHLLSDFKPSKASRVLAARLPQLTYRAHSIASNEYKDLSRGQEKARWVRAIRERTCRFALVRSSPEDSFESYLDRLASVRQLIESQGLQLAWPKARWTWSVPGLLEQRLSALLALLAAIATPIVALRYGLQKNPWVSFLSITLLCLAGASIVSILADNPLTRLQVVPFRGVKAAFLISWAGCFALLWGKDEAQTFLHQPLRRADALMLMLLAGVGGYFLMRTGNVGASWTLGGEQTLRNTLEQLLVARPRFKEFVIGYPLLLLGLHFQRARWGKLFIGLGMMGPISMVNTFCHLHSPLSLAYLRSANGILLGSLVGSSLLLLRRWLPRY